jgi:hypothetical protein
MAEKSSKFSNKMASTKLQKPALTPNSGIQSEKDESPFHIPKKTYQLAH